MEMERDKSKVAMEWVAFFGILGVVLGMVVFGLVRSRSEEALLISKTKAHVLSEAYNNKNCNDCHLGEDWLALFENPYVKENKNLRESILIQGKIKFR